MLIGNFKCSYCNRVFNDGKSLGGHKTWCENNPSNNQTRKKLSAIAKNQSWTKESRERASIKRIQDIEKSGIIGGFKGIKCFNVKCESTGINYVVRGTWELRTAIFLNRHGIIWENKNRISYNDNGIIRNYLPDFYLPIEKIYFEVKGYFKLKDRIKMNLIKEQTNLQIYIIDKYIISKIEDIDNLESILIKKY